VFLGDTVRSDDESIYAQSDGQSHARIQLNQRFQHRTIDPFSWFVGAHILPAEFLADTDVMS
jgi:hypothetical protein